MTSSRKSFTFFVLLLLTTVLLSMSVVVPVVAAGPLSQEYKVEVPYNDISAYDICAGDVDGDGVIEIVSVGYADDGSGSRGLLAIGTWDGEDAASEGGEQFLVDGMETWVYGVDVGDLDGDGFSEIVITGECDDGIHHHSWIRVYRWTGTTLTLLDTERWTLVDAWSNHVVVGDLDGDDAPEIVTCGGVYDGIEERCQLRVWSPSLTLEESEEWYTVGDTWAITVFVADVDGDGEKEVVTGGRAYDGTRYKAQLRVWSQDSPLTLKDSEEWYNIDRTSIVQVFVEDVDQDGVNEILTAGYANDHKLAQMIVWSYPDNTDPTITGLTPTVGLTANTGKPAIGASFSDDYSGIDVDSVSIKVGGTDVTAQATVTETGVTYTPSTDLSDGDYTVIVKVSDRSGNEATATWTFKVKILIFGLEPMMFYLLIIVLIVVVVIVVVFAVMRGRKPKPPPAPAYVPPPTAAPPTAYCPGCGTPVTPGTTFCPKCGRKLQ